MIEKPVSPWCDRVCCEIDDQRTPSNNMKCEHYRSCHLLLTAVNAVLSNMGPGVFKDETWVKGEIINDEHTA